MADRMKMSRAERAKQFAPFDALKGLQETMRMKEYEHDRIVRGELSEDEIKEISAILMNIQNGDKVQLEFFRDGHAIKLTGKSMLDFLEQKIYVGEFVILFEEIKSIKKLPEE